VVRLENGKKRPEFLAAFVLHAFGVAEYAPPSENAVLQATASLVAAGSAEPDAEQGAQRDENKEPVHQ
jgi:hypothetical protein